MGANGIILRLIFIYEYSRRLRQIIDFCIDRIRSSWSMEKVRIRRRVDSCGESLDYEPTAATHLIFTDPFPNATIFTYRDARSSTRSRSHFSSFWVQLETFYAIITRIGSTNVNTNENGYTSRRCSFIDQEGLKASVKYLRNEDVRSAGCVLVWRKKTKKNTTSSQTRLRLPNRMGFLVLRECYSILLYLFILPPYLYCVVISWKQTRATSGRYLRL